MVNRTYSVSLDDKIVVEAKKKAKNSGGKLSPLINELLIKWCKEQDN